MRKVGQGFEVSASDLVGYLYCRHLSALDRAVAEGALKRPPITDDPFLKILWGLIHEQSYVEHLTNSGLEVVKIEGVEVTDAAVAETVAAMKSGVQVIAQGALSFSGWVGRADILRRVEVPSALGVWSYEAVDTKVARETKGNGSATLPLFRAYQRSSRLRSGAHVCCGALVRF
jgi:predicted RecB family nuclease